METSTRWLIVCFVLLITACLAGGISLGLTHPIIPKEMASDIGYFGVLIAIVFAWPSPP